MLRYLAATVLGLAPLAIAVWAWRRVGRRRPLRTSTFIALTSFGALAGVAAFFAERWFWQWSGLSLSVATAGGTGALLATFLFAAPLEEALKVLVVWPAYVGRRLDGPDLGLSHAVSAAAGFAATESVLLALTGPGDAISFTRIALAIPPHAFIAGIWGWTLGSVTRSRAWFYGSWVLAVLAHGFYDHIAFGRGVGFLAAAAPMLLAMVALSAAALRDIAPPAAASGGWRASIAPLPVHLPEPPSLREMRRALRRTDRPLVLHWIVLGAFVNVGVVLTSTAVALWLGRRLGIDFAIAGEDDVRAGGPLVFLGTGILAAFPIAGYLVARASAATSVLEPAMAAAVAIAGVVAMLSMAAPIAVLFAIAVAPVAFGLACGGAWFGTER